MFNVHCSQSNPNRVKKFVQPCSIVTCPLIRLMHEALRAAAESFTEFEMFMLQIIAIHDAQKAINAVFDVVQKTVETTNGGRSKV